MSLAQKDEFRVGIFFPIYVTLPDGAVEGSQSFTRQNGRQKK